MERLILDVTNVILFYLEDKSKVKLLMLNKKTTKQMYEIIFFDEFHDEKTIMRVTNMLTKFKKIKNYNMKIRAPNVVTHLTFDNSFNKPIKHSIPNSITHLTFGDNFNQPIKDSIPNSVLREKIT